MPANSSKLPALGMHSFFIISIRIGALFLKFCLYMFLARHNGPEILGQLGILTSVVILFSAAGDLCLFQNIARESVTVPFAQTLTQIRQYIKTLPFQFLFVAVVCSVIAVNQVSNIVLALGILFVFCEMLNNNLFALMLNQGQPLTAQIHYFIRSALWIPVIYILYFFEQISLDLETLLSAWLISSMVAFVLACISLQLYSSPVSGSKQPFVHWIKTQVQKSISLAQMNGLTALNDNVTSFVLSWTLGLEIFGIFVYFQQVASALMNVVRFGIIQPLWPKLIQDHRQKRQTPSHLFHRHVMGVLILSLAGIVLAYPGYYQLTQWLGNHEFIDYFSVFIPILLLFLCSSCGCLQDAVFYAIKQERVLSRFLMIQLPLNCIIIVSLSMTLGLYGVAWGMVFLAGGMFIAKYRSLRSAGLADSSG